MADIQTPTPPPHPYYPPTLSLPNYDPSNQLNQLHALLYMFLPLTLLLTLTYIYTGTLRFPTPSSPRLTGSERLLASWYTINFALHIFFEGAFLLHAPYFTLHSSRSLLAALWREYALADSRYLLPPGHPSFTFIYAIELITVFVVGPMCVLCVLGIVKRKECRGVAMVVVSTAHLWSIAMYFLTGWLEGEKWCSEGEVYRWGYFWGMNAPWVAVSAAVVWSEVVKLGGGATVKVEEAEAARVKSE
ncbi:Emopamil binding protein-domain-containing protein [Tirmania nivea]|nr:Emopamil binding protein-domain-containing protein [Tirmania nivea]